MDRAPVRATSAEPAGPGPAADDSSAGLRAAGADRLRRHNWWALVGLVYAAGAFVVVAILATEPWGPLTVGTAVAAAAGSLGAGRLLQRRFPTADGSADGDDGLPVALIGLAVTGGLAVTLAAQWLSDDAEWAIVPGLVTGGLAVTVARRHRTTVVAGAVLVTAGAAAAAQTATAGPPDLVGIAASALLIAAIGGFLIYGLWACDAVERLEHARRLEGELAVADERLRFASDLHDIQGHHLQVIALKSELGQRLAELDPAAAGEQMREVQEHARTALRDTRAVVQGYRHASLDAELANATGVLAAAGIDGRLDGRTEHAVAAIPEAQRKLLALVTREATTNVLRHSHAAHARLALDVDAGWAVLRIRNDGSAATDSTADSATDSATGTGLTGLAGRFDALGGTVEWRQDGEWFTVTARLPTTEGG
ncbi:hypothetical protein GCM10009676_30110 [Prauserella halophila]|uniref:Signal transduction histidine kinase subgroup 3 dimerisation and phosphoacceptor domain-containing protein n=1 Tax=Prauserella halophila TaxID=185641 RepID=A0ABN1WGV0_9PSEU|nr:histidine kinase [Prauserella halophila]MCP2237066.1 two-component system, NarL family, sensor histidine kinase DesK [Prauserella halophila]